jgi:RNA-directed DNA polymerase
VSNGYEHLEYARWADDIVILVDGHQRHDWLLAAVWRRLQEELSKMQVKMNEEKPES